jgi:hypothetical protein
MVGMPEQRCIVVYLDSFPLWRVLRDRQARLASLGELQSTGDELRLFVRLLRALMLVIPYNVFV